MVNTEVLQLWEVVRGMFTSIDDQMTRELDSCNVEETHFFNTCREGRERERTEQKGVNEKEWMSVCAMQIKKMRMYTHKRMLFLAKHKYCWTQSTLPHPLPITILSKAYFSDKNINRRSVNFTIQFWLFHSFHGTGEHTELHCSWA